MLPYFKECIIYRMTYSDPLADNVLTEAKTAYQRISQFGMPILTTQVCSSRIVA